MMMRDRIVHTLKTHEAELRRRGVLRTALFGSAARGDAEANSDIDVLLDLDPKASISVFDYADTVRFIQSLFNERVDVSNRETLKPHVRPSAERDALAVF
ncbi:MAG: nucleotidyltransferase domain-containing protein [Rhodospirillaceae bacterium]|nr:nucleotidyltransferase domain-containing protein [Rhodospirillaceae bacterium]